MIAIPDWLPQRWHRIWTEADGEYADRLRQAIRHPVAEDRNEYKRRLALLHQLADEHPYRREFLKTQGRTRLPFIEGCGVSRDSFFAHHPILRAICGGSVLVRIPKPYDPIYGVMRWVDSSPSAKVSPAKRGMVATAMVADLVWRKETSPGWDNVVRSIEDRGMTE